MIHFLKPRFLLVLVVMFLWKVNAMQTDLIRSRFDYDEATNDTGTVSPTITPFPTITPSPTMASSNSTTSPSPTPSNSSSIVPTTSPAPSASNTTESPAPSSPPTEKTPSPTISPAPTTPAPTTAKPTPSPTARPTPAPTVAPTASPTAAPHDDDDDGKGKHPSLLRILGKTIAWLFIIALALLFFGFIMNNRYRIYFYIRNTWFRFVRWEGTQWFLRKTGLGRLFGIHPNESSPNLNQAMFGSDLNEGLLMQNT